MFRKTGLACSAFVAYALPAGIAYSPAAALIGVHRRLKGSDEVVLTFDDGPQPGSTERFARLLHDEGVRATFFMVGEQVKKNPSLVREVLEAGHTVGNHGYRHQNHLLRNPLGILDDVRAGANALAEITGERPRFFRPPQGVVTASTRYGAWRARSTLVLWDAWGRDWRPQATDRSIREDVLRTARAGSVILLHDGDRYGGRTWHATYAAVPHIIAHLRSLDLSFACLSDTRQFGGAPS